MNFYPPKVIQIIFALIDIALRNVRPIQCTTVIPYLDTIICHTNMEVDTLPHLWPIIMLATDMLVDMVPVLMPMFIVRTKP